MIYLSNDKVTSICPVCNGTGKYKEYVNYGTSTGAYSEHTCHGCNGKGWVEVQSQSTSVSDYSSGTYYIGSSNTTKYVTISLSEYKDLLIKEYIAMCVLNSPNNIDSKWIGWLRDNYNRVLEVISNSDLYDIKHNLSSELCNAFMKYPLNEEEQNKHIPFVD